jgi:hypothetical protein
MDGSKTMPTWSSRVSLRRRDLGRRSRRLRAASGLLLALFCTACAVHPAAAQPRPICGERSKILQHLDTSYREKPQALGLSADGGVLEVLASPNGSWTILISYPNRPTCMIAAGQAWENFALFINSRPA